MTTFVHRVYQSGNLVGQWGGSGQFPVLADPEFSMEVDGSLGPLDIQLGVEFDLQHPSLTVGNVIETFAFTEANPQGVLLHAGFLETLERAFTTSGSEVTCTVTPYVTQLANDFYRDDAAGTSIAKTFSAVEITTILQTILDKSILRSGTFSRIAYNSTSLQTTGRTATVEVGSETYLSAIQRTKKLGPGDWYWFISADGTFYYRNFDAGTQHTFTLGRDVVQFREVTDITELKNTVYFWNQSDAIGTTVAIERPASTSTSQTAYGRRTAIVQDPRIDDQTTAQGIADSYIQENQSPIKTYQIDVLSSGSDTRGYGIESIQPGDTCKLRNVPYLGDVTLSIVRVDYSPEMASLILREGPARRSQTLGMSLDDVIQYITKSTNGSIPLTTT